MRQLSICLLGPYQVALDGDPVTEFRSDKVRALLVYLAVQDCHAHQRDALAGLLWPDVPDRTARDNLRLSLHRLRQAVDDLKGESACFQITRETIQFKPAAAWVDATLFTALLATSQSHEHRHLEACAACMGRLAEAAALYRGDFLQGFFVDESLAFSEWVVVKREGLHRQVLPVLYHLAAYHRRRGELERAQAYARRQLELEPWREEAHRQLMDILARSGETSAALAQYERCRAVLAAELDVEPDEETERLYARIRMMRARPPHNLPPQATPFVGREKELVRIADLLADPDCQLLSIVGPGGIGKSRLAVQAALAAAEDARLFLHGVAFVSLTGVDEPEFLVPAIAGALDLAFRGSAEPDRQLIDYLRQRETLLVLDNCDQLLDAAGFLVQLLEQAPGVKLLVTSRERLNLHWEWLLPLEGLPYPQADAAATEGRDRRPCDSVRLFQVCARRVQPDFDLAGETQTAVMDLCRTVEGMPLAVELAAAWVGTLPVTHIATEITRNLDLSATAMRHLPARHRSLRAVFDHTWDRLSATEQRVWVQCTVFRGGFDREAAEAVVSEQLTVISEQLTVNGDETDYCSLITDHCLASLVDKSLLRFLPRGRYEMHELLRQYGAEKLAAEPQVQTAARDRHCAYYAAFLQRREPDLARAGAAETLAAIKTEIANIRAAWYWAVTQARMGEIERSLHSLSHFYLFAGPFQEGAALIRVAVDRVRELVGEVHASPHDGQTLLSRLLTAQACLLNRQGMYDQAIGTAQEATALARTARAGDAEAGSRLPWGIALSRKGAYELARNQLEQAVALARAAQAPLRPVSRTVEADGLRNLGIVSLDQGHHDKARAYYEQALHIYHQIGDQRGESGTLNNLGAVCYGHGDYAGATRYCEQALHIFREIGNRGDESTALSNLGLILVEQGNYAQAEDYFEQALGVCREIGSRQDEGMTLVNLGLLYHRVGGYDRARISYEQALRIYREIGDRRSEGLALSCLCLLSHHLGDDEAACEYGKRAVAIARDVGDPNVLGYALTRQGHALVALECLVEAVELYREALALRRELGQANLAMETLAGLARVSLAHNDPAQAQTEIDEILGYLEAGHDLDGTDEPFRVYLTCYHVLAANRDARGSAVLRMAHNLLQEQAVSIEDSELRRSFLEDVSAHREMVAEVKSFV